MPQKGNFVLFGKCGMMYTFFCLMFFDSESGSAIKWEYVCLHANAHCDVYMTSNMCIVTPTYHIRYQYRRIPKMSNKSSRTVRPSALYVVNFPTIFVAKSKDGVLHQQWGLPHVVILKPPVVCGAATAMIIDQKSLLFMQNVPGWNLARHRNHGLLDVDFTSWIDVPTWQLQLSNWTIFGKTCGPILLYLT